MNNLFVSCNLNLHVLFPFCVKRSYAHAEEAQQNPISQRTSCGPSRHEAMQHLPGTILCNWWAGWVLCSTNCLYNKHIYCRSPWFLCQCDILARRSTLLSAEKWEMMPMMPVMSCRFKYYSMFRHVLSASWTCVSDMYFVCILYVSDTKWSWLHNAIPIIMMCHQDDADSSEDHTNQWSSKQYKAARVPEYMEAFANR